MEKIMVLAAVFLLIAGLGAAMEQNELEGSPKTPTVAADWVSSFSWDQARAVISSGEYFVHANGLIDEVREDDNVEYETGEGRKGLNAVNVKVVAVNCDSKCGDDVTGEIILEEGREMARGRGPPDWLDLDSDDDGLSDGEEPDGTTDRPKFKAGAELTKTLRSIDCGDQRCPDAILDAVAELIQQAQDYNSSRSNKPRS